MNKKIFKGMSLAAISAVIATTMSTPVFAAVDAIIVQDNETKKLTEYSFGEIKKSQIEKMMGGEGKLYKSYLSKLANGKVYSYHDDEINDYVDAAKANKAYRDGLVSGNHISINDYTKTASAEAIIVPEGTIVKETIGENGEIVENPIEKPVIDEALKPAMEAVEAYEKAPITSNEEIATAEKLGQAATEKVNLVKDEKVKAELTAKIEAQNAKIAEAKKELNKVEVKEVSAINSRTVKVTLPEGSKVEAKDLKDKKITLKAGEVVLTATYAEGSLDKLTAVFTIDDKKELVDATVYSLSSDWTNFAKTDVLVKIARPYAKTFEVVTQKIASNVEDKESKPINVAITAKDQYGEAIKLDATTGANLEVKGTLNGMPLSSKEISLETTKDSVKLVRSLKEGDKVSINIQNKIGDKVAGESTFEYLVSKAEELVPTSIVGIKATKEGKEITEVAALDTLTLTADVRDQFNTPMGNKDVRWVVAEGKELLDKASKNENKFTTLGNDNLVLDSKQTTTLKVMKPGKVVIEAYNTANGKKAVYAFEVGAKKLSEITAPTDFDGNFNNEKLKTIAKFSVNEGAGLTVDAIKFNVVSKTTGVEASDIQVSAQLRGGDNNKTKNDIILVAKTLKAGKFEITPYVGQSFTDEKAIKANTVTLETKLNDVATSISSIDDIEAKVGTPIEKEIVIKNKYNEDITAESTGKIEWKIFKDGKIVDQNDSVKNDSVKIEEVVNSKTNKLEKVKFTANEEGDFVARIGIEGSAAFTEVKVSAEKTSLASINLGADIYDGVIAGDTDKVYRIIDARDNKGDLILPSIENWTVMSGKVDLDENGKVQVKYVAKDKDGKWDVVEKAKAEAIALVIDPAKNEPTEETPLSVTVTKPAVDDNDRAIEGKLNITVKKARELSKITVVNKNVSVGLKGKSTIEFSLQDQYGKAFAVNNLTDLKVSSSDETKVNVTEITAYDKDGVKLESYDKAKAVSYKVDITGAGTGSATLTVVGGEVKDTATVSVAPAAEIVKSIKIVAENEEAMNEDGTYKYQVNKEGVPFTIEARDASGNKVAVDTKDVIWVSSNESVATVKEGEVKGTLEKDAKDDTVTITATLFGVKNEIKLNVSGKDSKLDATSVKLEKAGEVKDLDKIDSDKTKDGIQLSLDGELSDGEAAEGTITLTFSGNNQYGEKEKVTGKELSYNTEVATVELSGEGDTLTITPVRVGNTKVTLTVDGRELAFDVKVTSENKIIKNKLEAAKTSLAGEIKAVENGYVKVSVNGSDIAKAEKWTTEAVKTALENEVKTAKAVAENKDATQKYVEDASAKLKLAVEAYTKAQKPGTKAE